MLGLGLYRTSPPVRKSRKFSKNGLSGNQTFSFTDAELVGLTQKYFFPAPLCTLCLSKEWTLPLHVYRKPCIRPSKEEPLPTTQWVEFLSGSCNFTKKRFVLRCQFKKYAMKKSNAPSEKDMHQAIKKIRNRFLLRWEFKKYANMHAMKIIMLRQKRIWLRP